MGGSGSTRRVTVEDNDGPGMVKISDDVIKRLRGVEEPVLVSEPELTPSSENKQLTVDTENSMTAAEAKRLQDEYNSKLKQLEQKNVDIYEDRLQQFNEAVSNVEKKFVNQTSSPICLELEQEVLKCYQDNPKQTLLCSRKVKDFLNCVESSRQKLLTKTG